MNIKMKSTTVNIEANNNDLYYGRIKTLSIRQKCGELETTPIVKANNSTALTINRKINAIFNFNQVQDTQNQKKNLRLRVGDLMQFRVIKEFGRYKAYDVIKMKKELAVDQMQLKPKKSKKNKAKRSTIKQKKREKLVKNEAYISGSISSIREQARDGIIKSLRKDGRERTLSTYFIFDNVVDYPEQKISVGDNVKFHKHNDVAFDVVRCAVKQQTTISSQSPSLSIDSITPSVTSTLPASSYHNPILLSSKRKKNYSRATIEVIFKESVVNNNHNQRQKTLSRSTINSNITSSQEAILTNQKKYSPAVPLHRESPTFPTIPHSNQYRLTLKQNVNVPFNQSNSQPTSIQYQYSGMNITPYQESIILPEIPSTQIYPATPLLVNDMTYPTDPAIYYSVTPISCINEMAHLNTPNTLYTQPGPVLSLPYTQPTVTVISGNSNYTMLQPQPSMINQGAYTPFSTFQ